MQNQNAQPGNSSEYDNPKNKSEHSLSDRINEKISTVKNWINETIHPKTNKELEEQTGDALAHIAEETIEASRESGNITEKEKSDIIDTVGAAAEQTIDGGLTGKLNNPIETLDKDGYGPELIETAVAIAETNGPMAEKVANEIDRVEGFENNIEDIMKYRERLLNGEATAAIHINGGESLTSAELKKHKNRAESWSDQRQIFHQEELIMAEESALELSKKLGPPSRIIAMRGCCGSGKSFAVKSMYGDRGIFDKEGDVPGAVKPDYFKTRIKQHEVESPPPPGIVVTSLQAHLESTGLNKMFQDKLAANPEMSLLIDKQLEESGDIPELIEMGKEQGKPVELLDNDVPVELSAYRVLKRQVGGVDPNIPYNSVSSGFKGVRCNRESVCSIVNNEEIVDTYSLRAFDPKTKKQVEIASKVDGKIMIRPGMEELAKSVIYQTEKKVMLEIEETRQQAITDEYIESFVARNFDDSESSQKYRDEARKILGAYAGLNMTFEQALASKADGIEADPDSPTFLPDYRDKLITWQQTHKEL